MRLVELYVDYQGTFDMERTKALVHTNASDNVLQSICIDIKEDKILNRANGIKGIIKVLRARGYECDVVSDIPSFGFSEE